MKEQDPLKNDRVLQDVPEHEGFKFLDPCVILAPLGKGGMGAVYRGTHVELEIDVAVKCLHPDLAHDETCVRRFKREAQMAARVNHKNLIRVYAVRETKNLHYIVMEFVEGENAAQRVARKGQLLLEEGLTIVRNAAAGLSEAHRQGIVHRDIKPENILISSRGEVKVADLGLSKQTLSELTAVTQTDTAIGTPAYMPPEQFTDFQSLGPPADVYSLGATLYFLLAGEKLYPGKTVAELWHQKTVNEYPDVAARIPGVPSDLVTILEKCGAKEPEHRFADAGELADALTLVSRNTSADLTDPQATGGHSVATEVSPPPAKTLFRIRQQVQSGAATRSARSRARRAVWVAAAALVAAVGAGAYFLRLADGLAGPVADAFAGAPPGNTPGGTDHPRGDPGAEERPEPDAVVPPPTLETLDARLQRAVSKEGVRKVLEDLESLRSAGSLSPAESERARSLEALALRRLAQHLHEARSYREALAAYRRSLDVADSAAARLLLERLEVEVGSALVEAVSVPTPGAPVARRPFLITGRVTDPAVEGVVVGGREVAPRGGRFELLLGEGLADGRHRLPVVVRGPQGVEAQAEPIDIIIDTSPPLVSVLAPARGAWVGTEVTVEGRLDDLTPGSVEVNGVAASLRPDGAWTAKARPRAEGRITVRALDRAGHATVETLSVRVDAEKPVLSIDEPRDGSVVPAESVLLSGSVRDASGAVVRLEVDGAPVAVGQGGRFRTSVPLAGEGVRRIEIRALDPAGNPAVRAVTVRRDTTPPALAWLRPDAPSVAAGRVLVEGTVDDGGSRCRVLVNGREAAVDGGSWKIELRLSGGTHRFEVVAEDPAGNRSEPLVRTLAVIPEGFSFLGRNPEGLPEYRQERSGIVFVLLPGGEFDMGSPSGEEDRAADEGPVHRVRVSPFLIAKHEVSQMQWERVMGTNPSFFRGDDLPVEQVSWEDCRDFCRRAGLALPTESQWEYACRAGTSTAFAFGPTVRSDQVNYNGNRPYGDAPKGVYRGETVAVGSFAGNAFGLYDMHGNVEEWCRDRYDAKYYSRPEARDGDRPCANRLRPERVLRGGSWRDRGRDCRSASRDHESIVRQRNYIGFRPIATVR